MTNSPDAGGATESLPNSLQGLGNSTAPDAKHKINLSSNSLDSALDALLSSPPKKQNGMVCSVSKVLENLPKETCDKLNAIMDNEKVVAHDITNLLKSYGFQVSAEVMRRHRRRAKGGGCTCPV